MTQAKEQTFSKKLVSLIIPMTLQNFMFALVPISDAAMLVALNQDSMSAVSLAAQVTFVLNLFLFGISAGTNMFAAQYWGKGDKESIEKLMGYSTKLLLPIAVLFFSMAMFLPTGLMRIYTNVPGIIDYGVQYLRVASFSYLFMSLAWLFEAILKNTGFVRESTAISISMVILNIILNGIFIFGLLGLPPMGAAGAALATTLSSLWGFVGCIWILLKKCSVKLRIKHIINTDENIRKEFSRYTTPFMANQLFWGIGFTMISVIIGHLGADATAANAIAAVVKDLVSCFCYALGSGGAIVVGNELGAGRLEKGKEYGNKITKLTIISGAILGILVALSAPLVLKIVNLTPQASEYLKYMLWMCSYYILGRSINSTTIGGIFAAGGDTKFGFICDTITMWVFIVPAGFLAAFYFNLPVLVVYFILNLDEMIKLPVVFIHYRKYKWVRNIVGDKPDEEYEVC
ncbi:MAG: MATE family efflux transporter [Clostridiales bacterium]|nr:MATE family efflux transporter [Clostridiales bacterium]